MSDLIRSDPVANDPVITDDHGEPAKNRRMHFDYECPLCGGSVHMIATASLRLHGIRESLPDAPVEREKPEPQETFNPREAAIIARAENTGIMKAFTEAVASAAISQPKDPRAYFLHFLRTMRLKQVEFCVLEPFKNRYPNKYIEFYGAQGVVCITVDKAIRHFVPADALVGQPIRKLGTEKGGGNGQPRFDVDVVEVLNWIKTGRGYVPAGSQEFAEALKKQSMGAYDRPMVSGN